jgi:uncharacterized protein (DUF1684 family)
LKLFINSEGMLFLPFKDLTSGKETYGAGRYIDLDPKNEKDSQIEIDFNLAYHPFVLITIPLLVRYQQKT